MKNITSQFDYPYWAYYRIDLNIDRPKVEQYLINKPGVTFLWEKLYVQYPAPGDPPVFQELEFEFDLRSAGKIFQNIPIKFTGHSTPGKGIRNGTFFDPAAQLNGKYVGWPVQSDEVAVLSISNFTALIAGNYVDVMFSGRGFRNGRLS